MNERNVGKSNASLLASLKQTVTGDEKAKDKASVLPDECGDSLWDDVLALQVVIPAADKQEEAGNNNAEKK